MHIVFALKYIYMVVSIYAHSLIEYVIFMNKTTKEKMKMLNNLNLHLLSQTKDPANHSNQTTNRIFTNVQFVLLHLKNVQFVCWCCWCVFVLSSKPQFGVRRDGSLAPVWVS